MNASKIQQKTLNKLLDKYEKSKTFLETNKVNQTFTKLITELFPKYEDDAEYEFFCEANEALEELQARNLIELHYKQGNILHKVCLNVAQLEACYAFVNRKSKKDENTWFENVWKSLKGCEVLRKYVEKQRTLLSKNNQVEYYNGNHTDYVDMLTLVQSLVNNENEVYIRDFSMKLFADSKRVEQLSSLACALLFSYGDYQEKENVLEECGVVRTPTYVCMKGKGRLLFAEQEIDLSKLPGDIALSTNTLQGILQVCVDCEHIITIENLTSFHDFSKDNTLAVYLGGFHNKTKRDFLKLLYQQNPDKSYRHFGDIDAGGFYILEHLRRKTGIPFAALGMDIYTMQSYQEKSKPLTENDRRRLKNIAEIYPEHRQMIHYMLNNNCKLEQEAVKEIYL